MESTPPLVLAVLTFRRNDLLAQALPKLAGQVEQARTAGHDASLLVVDNDPAGGARETVEAAQVQVPLRYVNEEQPGLAAARNRALDEAREAGLLAFIDDDETPGEDWLLRLVGTWRATGAPAVTGPVRSLPVAELDAWIQGTAIFRRETGTTGAERRGMATNNLLLDMGWIRDHGVRFDARFGLTGGEDSKFGQDLRAAGGRVVWCDEAEVSETVPAERLEHEWISKRLTRFGESWVRARVIDRTGADALRFRATTLARGLVRAGKGQAGLLLATRRGDEMARGRAAAERAGGLGLLRGVVGVNREEYARGR